MKDGRLKNIRIFKDEGDVAGCFVRMIKKEDENEMLNFNSRMITATEADNILSVIANEML